MTPNYVYVAYQDSSSNAFLGFVEPNTNAIAATVPIGTVTDSYTEYVKLGVSPDGARVYAINNFSKTLYVVDTVNPGVIATVDLSSMSQVIMIHFVLVTPDSQYVYLAGAGTQIGVVDTTSNQLLHTLGVSGNVQGMTAGAGYVFIEVSQNTVDATPIGSSTIITDIFNTVSNLYGPPAFLLEQSELSIVEVNGTYQIQSMNQRYSNSGGDIYYSSVTNLTDSHRLTDPALTSPTVAVTLSNNMRYVTQNDPTGQALTLSVLRMHENQVIEQLTPAINYYRFIAVSPDENWVCVTIQNPVQNNYGLLIFPVVPISSSTPAGQFVSFAALQHGLEITPDSQYAYMIDQDLTFLPHVLNSVILATQTSRPPLTIAGTINTFVSSYRPYTMRVLM